MTIHLPLPLSTKVSTKKHCQKTSYDGPVLRDRFNCNVFREKRYEVITLDINPNFDPDISIDLLQWDYQASFPPGNFDVLAVSPHCIDYRTAAVSHQGDLKWYDSVV